GTFAGGLGAVAANAIGLSTSSHLLIVSVVMGAALLALTSNLLPDDEQGHGDGGESEAVSTPPARRVRGAPVVLLVVAGMFAVVAEVTGGDWASFRLTDDFGATAAWGSVAFVAFTVGM